MSALHFLELDPNKTRLLLRTFCLRIAKTQLDNAPGKITYKELEGVAARLEESLHERRIAHANAEFEARRSRLRDLQRRRADLVDIADADFLIGHTGNG